MRPNPSDQNLDLAVRAAQSERARPEAVELALDSILNPSRKKRTPFPRLAIAAIAGVGFLLLPLAMPRKSGAWAQVAAQTANAPRLHEVVSMRHPRTGEMTIMSERWVDGRRWYWGIGPASKYGAMASDGRRVTRYFRESRYATVAADSPRSKAELSIGYGLATGPSIEDLLKNPELSVEGEPMRVEGPEGPRLRYRLLKQSSTGAIPGVGLDKNKRDVVQVYVVPDDPRIRRWEVLDPEGSVSNFGEVDYPDAIPAERFVVTTAPDARIYDLDKGRKILREQLLKGLGTKSVKGQSMSLRVVLAGPWRDLWVLWTGAPPNGDLTPPVQWVGNPAKVYGLTMLTSKVNEYVPSPKFPMGLKQHLGGMVIHSKGGVPAKTVSLSIPVFAPNRSQPIKNFLGKPTGFRSKFVGRVTYENVPVLDIGPVYMYHDVLGLVEPRPYEALVHDYRKKGKP